MIPIILINLDKDVTRLQHASEQLLAMDLPIYRYSAINGKDVDLAEIPTSLYTRYLIDNPNSRCSHQQLNSIGGVGCYLSHYNVWNLYQDIAKQGIYIFEDDLTVCPDFKTKLEAIEIPKDCDVLSFGYLGLLENAKLKENVTKSDAFFFGLQGYYVSSQGMKKLVKHAFPIEVHVDAYIALLAKLKIINLYFTKETMVTQSQTTPSNITTDYCYKCALPSVSLNTLIYTGIGIVLFLIVVGTCVGTCVTIKRRK